MLRAVCGGSGGGMYESHQDASRMLIVLTEVSHQRDKLRNNQTRAAPKH